LYHGNTLRLIALPIINGKINSRVKCQIFSRVRGKEFRERIAKREGGKKSCDKREELIKSLL
jgi:hypothetical protein